MLFLLTIDSPVVEERLPLPIIKTAQVQTRNYDSLSQKQSIDELSLSIRKHGLLQPIIVRPINQGFEIVAGHRRFQACKLLRWKTIPAMVKDVSDKDAFEIQLVENIQRNSLDPIEEAQAFKVYVTDYGWGGVTHLANTIMKSEQYVSSRLQLLELPQKVIDRIKSGELKVSHAFELLGLEHESRESASYDVISKNMSVKEIRKYKSQLALTKDKGIVEHTDAKAEHTIYDNDHSNDDFHFPKNYGKDHTLEQLHHKLMFLKKVQLSLKASLSRADSLIHEYEELDAPGMKVTISTNNNNCPETDMQGDSDNISTMLIRFRLGIHSMLDETIRSTSKLTKEESILQ